MAKLDRRRETPHNNQGAICFWRIEHHLFFMRNPRFTGLNSHVFAPNSVTTKSRSGKVQQLSETINNRLRALPRDRSPAQQTLASLTSPRIKVLMPAATLAGLQKTTTSTWRLRSLLMRAQLLRAFARDWR